MSVKRLLLSFAGTSVLVGAVLATGAQSVGAQSAPDFNQNCPSAGLNLSAGPTACDSPTAPPTTPAPPPVTTTTTTSTTIAFPFAQFLVSQDSYLNLVAQQLGVSRTALNGAFQAAEAAFAQTKVSPTQDQILDLAALYLGVSSSSINVAFQQSSFSEVNVLQQFGVLSPGLAAAYDSSIASGSYGVGLGFGVPDFSAPAI